MHVLPANLFILILIKKNSVHLDTNNFDGGINVAN